MKLINTFKNSFATRLAMVAGLMLSFVSQASAEDKFYVEDFSIKAGEKKEIAIYFDSEATDYNQLTATIALPEGLSALGNNNALRLNTKRAASFIKSWNSTEFGFVIRGIGSTISAGTDPIAYLSVTAGSALAETSAIMISNVSAKKTDKTEVSIASENATVTLSTEDSGGQSGGEMPAENSVTWSFAQSNVTINAGETTVVDIQMTNNFAATGFNAYLKPSKGLTITSVTAHENRVPAVSYSAKSNKVFALTDINGNEGSIFSVTLQADESYSGNGSLIVSDISVTNSSSASIQADDIQLPISVLDNGSVAEGDVVFSFDTEDVVLTPDKSTAVTVALTSDQALKGFNGTLILPENVTAVVDAGDLLASAPLYTEATGKLIYLGDITGNEGVLMKITLTANSNFDADGTIQLSNISVTNEQSKSILVSSITLTIKARDDEAKAAADAIAEEVQAALDEAKAAIDADDADVAADYTDQEAAIQQKIDDLKAEIENNYETNSIDLADVQAQADAIKEEIADMKADADAAQQLAEDKTAFEAYKTEQEAAADDKAEEGDSEAAQQLIDTAKADIEALKYDESKTLDENKADVDAILAKLDEDLAAQREADAQAANDAAYERLSDEIAALQQQLDNANNEIVLNYSDVAEEFEDDIDAIQEQINALQQELDAAKAAVELTAESELDADKVDAIEDAIEKVLADAAAAHEAASLIGDVNRDGVVDGADYRIVLNHVLNGGEYIDKYDINGDNKVNVVDASAITNIILYGNWQGQQNAAEVRSSRIGGNSLTMRAVSADRLALVIDGEAAYNAFQMDVNLTDDMKLQSVTVGSAAAGHEVLTCQLADGRTRIVVISADNSTFATGTLLYFNVTGKGSLQTEDIIFADGRAEVAYLTLDSDATGIVALRRQIAGTSVYDLSGRRANSTSNGVNIVRQENGTVKKVAVRK